MYLLYCCIFCLNVSSLVFFSLCVWFSFVAVLCVCISFCDTNNSLYRKMYLHNGHSNKHGTITSVTLRIFGQQKHIIVSAISCQMRIYFTHRTIHQTNACTNIYIRSACSLSSNACWLAVVLMRCMSRAIFPFLI